MTEVLRLEQEVSRIAKSLKSNSDIDIKNIELDELSVIITDFLKSNFVYQDLCDINFKFDFYSYSYHFYNEFNLFSLSLFI
ncbi:hypothetical protein btBTE5EL_001381 (plasmid) [Borrelia turicatae]|nr:hypothetical protein btBTE5EL_001381 [Borrelia turicatae]